MLFALVNQQGAVERRQEFPTFAESWDALTAARAAALVRIAEIRAAAGAELGPTGTEALELQRLTGQVSQINDKLGVMAPKLAAGKGLRWLPDNPPAFDSRSQTRNQVAPIPSNAVEVPYRIAAIALDEVKAAAKGQVGIVRFEKETAGVVLNGVLVATDRESQGLVDSMHRSLVDGVITSVKFKTASGSIVTANTALATALRSAVVQHVQACRNREAELIEAIDAAKDPAAVLAIDLNAGWPAPAVAPPGRQVAAAAVGGKP